MIMQDPTAICNATVSVKDVEGNWSDIGTTEGESTQNYLEMWFDHGKNPTNGSYSYVLLPETGKEETAGGGASQRNYGGGAELSFQPSAVKGGDEAACLCGISVLQRRRRAGGLCCKHTVFKGPDDEAPGAWVRCDSGCIGAVKYKIMIWELRGKYENLFLYRTKSENDIIYNALTLQ